ncbi:protein METABOLIC NETWORK MODULATOR 1-like isoform X2 [Pyrus communis]|uniref:protein METABOLIC NETWORK MODULATOR 1-like isoform X2 n=2 Tax=Pyrus TaxID=3766 RepID=UPI0035BFC604
MSQSDQGNTPDGSSSIPMKRKRGRPRKYPKPDLEENAHVRNTPNLNTGENAGNGVPSAPPGFLGRNGYQPHRRAPTNGAADVMVGTVVSGVIDATFDGGYLLSVRVGNSPTTLRGVIFKPGRYVPVSAENDVAPDVQMIRRNVIPNPAEISYFHGSSPRSRDAIRSVNHVASKRKHVVPVAPQTANPLLSRGNLLPVILQPRNLSEGVPLTGLPNSVAPGASPTNGSIRTNWVPLTNEVANQSSDLATSKVKQVPSVPPSNGSISTNQIPTVGNQSLVFEGGQNENGTCNQPSTEMLKAEAKSTRLPNIPFEKLVTEVVKRIDTPSQAPAHSTEVNIECSKSTGSELEDDMDQPLVIEPLQAIQPKEHSMPLSKPPEDDGNGKMSELLQESMRESESTTDSRVKSDEPSQTALGDEESDHSRKPSEA